MFQNTISKSKIIATIGPACNAKETLKKMIFEGIDVCRLNFSHGSHEDHKKVIGLIRELNEELGTKVAILADLQGPKLRVGAVQDNGVELVKGSQLKIVTHDCLGTATCVYLSYKPLPLDVMPGETILIDDGKIKLEVIETNREDTVTTRIVNGGMLSSKKGVNLPNTKISLPSLTDKDIEDVNFALSFDVDWIALSFVRSGRDILQLKKIIEDRGKHTRIVAKIEKPEALEDIDAIIDAADAIMVARGDLGVEIPFDRVPMVQKQIVSKCIMKGKAVIIATQMMESMMTNFRPTRAEATDVANAVVEGADALMLSGETSVGQYPVEAIISMQQVISATEGKGFELPHENQPNPKDEFYLFHAVCYNVCKMAELTNAKGIVVFSYNGGTVFEIAKNRPKACIYAFSPNSKVLNQLSLLWGVNSFYLDTDAAINDAIAHTSEILKDEGYVMPGDVLVYAAGLPMHERGPIDTMKIEIVS
jgi:pyruvate kinase